MARPSDYVPDEHPKAVRLLAAKWKSQREIAEVLGIAHSTFVRWLAEHPELSVQYKLGREDATDNVERALYERATGYTFPSEKIVVVSGGQGMGSSVERVDITEHYPPDPAALKLWLTNRRGKDWSDKQSIEHTVTVTPEEMAARRKRARDG